MKFESEFVGKTCIVTGAASGIGKTTALEMGINCGSNVVVADINKEGVENTVNEIISCGGKAIGVHGDLSDEIIIQLVVSKAVENFGQLNHLVSTVARTSEAWTQKDKNFEDFDAQYIMDTFSTNVISNWLLMKHCITEMIKFGGGSIVCVSSSAAHGGASGNNVYGASKAALERLVTAGAYLYGKQGIRVNAVSPSITMTPALKETIPNETLKSLKHGIMNPDYTGGEKIATVISFLLSDDAYTIQGATIPTDNGYSEIPGGVAIASIVNNSNKNEA